MFLYCRMYSSVQDEFAAGTFFKARADACKSR
jgi:hypothetical protein